MKVACCDYSILNSIPLPLPLKWRLISDRDPVAENRKREDGNYP